jgi:hypothetical protein
MMDDSKHQVGDGPIQEEFRVKMVTMARALDDYFNGENCAPEDRTVGFICMVFPLNAQEGRCNYISNADRQDVIIMLKEQLAYFEGQKPTAGTA